MSFDSPFFLCVYLPLTAILYSLLPSRKPRKWLLLGVSILFCAFGSFSGAVTLLISALCSYYLGRRIPAVGILLNLILLCFYKYAAPPSFIVPIGISFFTFRSISYLADGKQADSFSDFLLYVSFFPQLTAGPIARFDQFQLVQTSAPERALGFRRFLWGLGKKLLLVYPLSQLVTTAYGTLNFSNAWLGAVSYMLQIFLDFSAYSDMAIGLSRFFGASAPENFDAPYTAVSVTDFWRRWHISLSRWFRDYVYIPLGGNRKGRTRAALNKLAVFALCGLWHGTGWTFLLWGLWHGIFAGLETLRPVRKSLFSRLYTLLVVCIGFVLFRAGDLHQAAAILKAMFSFAPTIGLIPDPRQYTVFVLSILLCLPVEKWFRRQEVGRPWLTSLSYCLCLILLLFCLGALAANGFQPFIYAQF